jgi:hypothetical protein
MGTTIARLPVESQRWDIRIAVIVDLCGPKLNTTGISLSHPMYQSAERPWGAGAQKGSKWMDAARGRMLFPSIGQP